ncbi:MAG: hypothetical protein GY917_27735, partial [Planctomycetaceae bacterium]|nr:hypothetical protein [Planctomycetaceae bacterium]
HLRLYIDVRGLNFANQLPSLVALDDSYTIANDAALVRPQLLLRNEEFNGVPNWAALGSGSGGNEFSYHQDSNFAGGTAGEVGGRFTRSGFSKHLADTQFSSELDVEKAIHADGRLDVTGWNHADFGNGMSVGHFSTNGQATLGLSFTDNSTGSNLYWYGIVQFDDGTLVATGHTQITSANSNRSWS